MRTGWYKYKAIGDYDSFDDYFYHFSEEELSANVLRELAQDHFSENHNKDGDLYFFVVDIELFPPLELVLKLIEQIQEAGKLNLRKLLQNQSILENTSNEVDN